MDRSCAIVTGAGSGLGLALARQLAAKGHALVLVDRDPVALQSAMGEFETLEARVIEVAADVATLGGWQQALSAFHSFGLPLRWLVNAAGIAVAGSVGEVPVDEWRRVLDVNLLGPIWGCQTFLPALLKQTSGRIVNVASRAAFTAPPQMGPYAVSKAGLVAFTETLASELRGTGITATVACPGFFRSGLAGRMRAFPPNLAELAARFIAASGRDAEAVARLILRHAEAGDLYAIPGGEDRFLWRFKRLAPKACLRMVARRYYEALAKF
ncbi:MAG: SDR family NAD(P)-dependent oxidoreductase [Holophagaceae bacterium]|nr:SDR family NAD(P)-dependent oxidoreductase [Holophagaceae bacterium]